MLSSLRTRLIAARQVLAGRPLIYNVEWRHAPMFEIVEGNHLLIADCVFDGSGVSLAAMEAMV